MSIKEVKIREINTSSRFPTFIAFVTKGLENISRDEIAETFPNVSFMQVTNKYIIFTGESVSIKNLIQLKTVDDIHILLWYKRNSSNLSIDYIVNSISKGELFFALKLVKKIRSVGETFSVTTSKFKNERINTENLKEIIAKKITNLTDMKYTPFDHSNFDLRLHIELDNIIFSCKISKNSLYVRFYRECEREGSLKATIGASMCRIAACKTGSSIVDNFCGTGTILCEAKMQGLIPYGGDIDSDSVICAQKNLEHVFPEGKKNIHTLDAKKSFWPSKFFDCAISNYPWGKQIHLDHASELYSKSISEYSRILKDDGRLVLLGVDNEIIVKYLKKFFPNRRISSFKIGFLGQTPWICSALPPQ